LPKVLADEVKAHFKTLVDWFSGLLTAARAAGDLNFTNDANAEAEELVATIYGAMLTARAMGAPHMFTAIVDQALAKLQRG
jgi:TetR/AcrR family transcriptional repressor of nem operon